MAIPENETRLDEEALARILEPGTGWRREGQSLTKTYTFKGWKRALAFVQRVGAAADEQKHHPDVHVEGYRNVRIVLTTHATGRISDADIALARRLDELVGD